jgi:hypothetical protein
MRGNLYYIRGNVRIQITTESKVFFYLINKDTFLPELENVMYNFIKCSSLLFGARVRYSIAFKSGETSFDIFTRRCYHNFKVCINTTSFEGASGVELGNYGRFALAQN